MALIVSEPCQFGAVTFTWLGHLCKFRSVTKPFGLMDNEFRPHEFLGDVTPMQIMPRIFVKEISSFKLSPW